MHRSYKILMLFFVIVSFSMASCSPKVGCETAAGTQVKTKKGELSMKRGSSSLFPKKSMKRRN